MILVLMGVCGSGKTTIGKLLCERTGLTFADADDYHLPGAKQKMASGLSLNDEDRAPWLATLNQLLRSWDQQATGGILACSALEEKYREMLCCEISRANIRFIFLDVPRGLLEERLLARSHPFMNPKLLDRQLATLEPPIYALHIINDSTPEQTATHILAQLSSTKL